MADKRRCIQTIDAFEAAKGPDAKTVLAVRLKTKTTILNDSDDEELLHFESDEEILRQHRAKKLTKHEKAQLQVKAKEECLQRQQRREEEARRRQEAFDREVRDRERYKPAPDPLADVPNFFSAKRPRAPSPLPENLPEVVLKLALDCDYDFISHHNCVTKRKPLRLKTIWRGGREVLHCVVNKEAGVERCIDVDLEKGEAWLCKESHR